MPDPVNDPERYELICRKSRIDHRWNLWNWPDDSDRFYRAPTIAARVSSAIKGEPDKSAGGQAKKAQKVVPNNSQNHK
jgi:hypothetical protein